MAVSIWRVNWRGEDVKRRVLAASKLGVDDTMAAAVNEGKQNHPGWSNVTGTAEGSIAIQQPAHEDGRGVVGRWGSMGVLYFIFLEILHGAALRHAADVTYPSLTRRIKEHLR